MRTRLLLVLSVIALASLLGLAGSASAGGRPLSTDLSGAEEVPPADPDGSGFARITLNSGTGEVCWSITASDITLPATAAHIHEAPAGVNGGIVVTLSPPDESGNASGCTIADGSLVKDIRKNPAEYYVNVHTTDFPGGAIRGQLG
jgi:hypothetical protein